MDIIIYIGLIALIGMFFFLDKFTKTQNSMFIIILLSLIGFIMVANTTINIVEYGEYELLEGSQSIYTIKTIDVTDSGFGIMNVQAFILLIFVFFLLLSSINLTLGRDY